MLSRSMIMATLALGASFAIQPAQSQNTATGNGAVNYKFNKIQVVDASDWRAQSYNDYPKNRLKNGGDYAA